MRKKLFWVQFVGFVFVSVVGSLLHFLYDWTKKSVFVALFSATNESTWEHMKLFFVPALIFAIIEYFIVGREYPNFWSAKLIGIVVGLLSIPILYYTFVGAFGMSPDWVNVLIFYIATALSFVVETIMILRNRPNFSIKLSIVIFVIIGLCFIIFTFLPPPIPLFVDPTTGLKGI